MPDAGTALPSRGPLEVRIAVKKWISSRAASRPNTLRYDLKEPIDIQPTEAAEALATLPWRGV